MGAKGMLAASCPRAHKSVGDRDLARFTALLRQQADTQKYLGLSKYLWQKEASQMNHFFRFQSTNLACCHSLSFTNKVLNSCKIG